MTATETVQGSGAEASSKAVSFLRSGLLFGTGLGISLGKSDLHVTVVKARPGGATVTATHSVKGYRTRPAAVWGAELTDFLQGAGAKNLAATIVLARHEMIVRTLQLPGVPEKEIESAVALQVDTLHPFGEEEIVWASARLTGGAVLVGLTRRAVLDEYETLFAEAGIAVAAVTFSAAVLYAAARLWNVGAPRVLTYFAEETTLGEPPRVEIYGESEARPVYSAEFPLLPERALAVARKELRLAPETPALTAKEILPGMRESLLADPIAAAAGVCGAVPRSSRIANLLPPERRAAHGQLQIIIPAVLAVVLVVSAIVVYGLLPTVTDKKFAEEIAAETGKLEPAAKRAQALEAKALADRARVRSLDEFKSRAQADLDALNELTKLLPPPTWTNTIEIFPDSIVLVGETDQAAPLLKILDGSPLFQNSEFGLSVMRGGTTEQFRIKTMRRGRLGRTTP